VETPTLTPPRLAQRGRAAISFQAGIGRATSKLMAQTERALAEAGVTAETLPEDMEMRHAMVQDVVGALPAFTISQFLAEWRAKVHRAVALDAFEEVQSELVAALHALDAGPSTLAPDEPHAVPAYWQDTEFHRTAGGWDSSAYNGYVHGEVLHKLMLAKMFPGDIFAQRRAAAAAAPRRDYGRILDMGASSGHYTIALAEMFPQARITGIDLSPRMLEHARRSGNARGAAWEFHVRAAEDTGFAAGSFDFVTSYNLLHELPPPVIDAVFAEAFRLLAPGGDMLMSDVPRYAELDRLTAWRFDHIAKWGGEPFWRASASMDLADAARRAGLIDVVAGGIGDLPTKHPYVVQGRKPTL
jgi:2-polyprenyl-3-methyl-5-hydroxy-6-metoxy-1,4-benzoquinol methylase